MQNRVCPRCGATNIRTGSVSHSGFLTDSNNLYYCVECGFSSVFFPEITRKEE